MTLTSINPATGRKIRSYPETPIEEANQIIERAHLAAEVWRQRSFGERAQAMKRAAEILRREGERFAELMADEMGKPLDQGRGEIDKCAWVCEFYADHASDFLADTPVETDASMSYITYQPLGVVLAIMPWNFPFWQVFRFAAPSLMAGNAAVLKHARNVPGCATAIEALMHEAGFPRDLFRALFISTDAVDGLIENPLIQAVTLTGSVAAGKAVAAKAGSLLKRTVLELGGSDPYLILHDANLEQAARTCVASRLINSGQSCIAAKRFIVVESVHRRFEELVVEQMSRATYGDPKREEPDLGPMARPDLRDQLHDQVQRSVAMGAELLLGGEIPEGSGAFYPPTVLTNVKPGMPAFDEETFGPVAAIATARDDDMAIELANDTSFGLGAAVFTRDIDRGEQIARERLRAGSAFVNAFVRSDPRLPFGGIKESGYGRELGSFGIREFVNVKTVYVR